MSAPAVTPAELRAILRDMRAWIRQLVNSYQEWDGKIWQMRDPKVLKEIAGIQKAISILSAADLSTTFPPRIERGIPIPSRQSRNCHPKPKWTLFLRQMKKGDSVFVPANWAPCIVTSAHRIGVRTSRQFIGQKVRIWRTN